MSGVSDCDRAGRTEHVLRRAAGAPATLHANLSPATQKLPILFLAWYAYIMVAAEKSRRYGIAPAQIPVFLSQKPST